MPWPNIVFGRGKREMVGYAACERARLACLLWSWVVGLLGCWVAGLLESGKWKEGVVKVFDKGEAYG